MNEIKTKVKKFFSVIEFLLIALIPIWVMIIIWGFGYIISASNLPDWFKFFLLK